MKQNFIKRLFAKIVAGQLRRPGGILANKVGNQMNEANRFLYDFTIKEMRLTDNESILEIGFGNGKFFQRIFSAAGNLKISGLDFSPEMVNVASRNNPADVKSGNLTLRLGSSDKIPFPDNSFDKVFCINVIYFWGEPAEHLKEIYRVLKPGGSFYTSIRTKESMTHMPFSKHGFTLYTQEEWINKMKASSLHFERAEKTQNEPDAEFGGQRFKVESLCIVAEKK